MIKRILVAVVTIALISVVGVGTYTRLYLPSTRPMLTGAPPVAPKSVKNFSAEPMSGQPQKELYTEALHEAVAALKPDYRVEAEQLYVKRGGYSWNVVEKVSVGYFDMFGFVQSAHAKAEVHGETVDYLIWRPDWLHSVFDDRIVIAVALASMLEPDYGTMVFGYFEMRPA